VENIADPEQICEPYSLNELQDQGRKYIDTSAEFPNSRGDYAILDFEASVLQSFARAFNERHTSKLRHFSHAAGVSDIIGRDTSTGVINQVEDFAKSLVEENRKK
jgi:hypothetical protein